MRSPSASLRLVLGAGLLAVLAGPGCSLYSSSDDDCPYGGTGSGGGGAGIASVGQRNPDTGECVYSGGGVDCTDPCAPCPAAGADQAALPSWGYCDSQCTGLDEQSCLGASGCRAIYLDQCNGAPDCGAAPIYSECWSTDMTGPVEGGGCDGLDAYTCSRHDDCVAIHQQDCSGGGTGGGATDVPVACTTGGFLACGAEPGAGGPGSCTGDVTCDAAPPMCPVDATPGIADGCYTGYCIPTDQCDTPLPGLCYAEVTCGDAAPLCPDGTTPGIADGCYTGYCIPLDKCEAAPACGDITVEATCVARQDCSPYYRGEGCSCDANGCTCTDWVFDSCQ